MRIIGIAGGIGSGKSVVSRILRCKGYEVYDCDSRAKMLMESDEEFKRRLRQRMGEDCVLPEGLLNRARIAEIVFGTPQQLAWLNEQVHCMVREDLMRSAGRCGSEIYFVESAIMRTAGLDKICEEIWEVEATVALRIERVCGRDACDVGKVMARIEAQKGECDGLACPVRIIRNDGERELLGEIEFIIHNS